MAFWHKKQTEFEEMDRIIRDNPGISPAELRETLMGETRRLARMYGWEVHRAGEVGGDEEDYDVRRFRDIFGD